MRMQPVDTPHFAPNDHIEDHQRTWNETAFSELVRKGTHAWADVPDDWLENLRSGQE